VNEASRIVVALTLSAFGAASLGAQSPAAAATTSMRTVIGRVLDEASHGIPGANVRASSGASTVSDGDGRFVLRNLPDSALQLVARKVGYDSTSVTVSAGADAEFTITLARTHLLNEIVVEGKAYDRALWDNGFYHRQKIASGMFFDPDAIAHFGGNGLGSLVQQVPRVDVRHLGNQDYAFSTIAGRPCRMNVYIDGFFQRVAMPGSSTTSEGRAEEGLGLNELIGFHDVAAVEVYPRASAVPVQYQRMGPPAGPQGVSSAQIGSPNGSMHRSLSQGENADAACGAIVIWTKPPGR
jgi:hypothetical protein